MKFISFFHFFKSSGVCPRRVLEQISDDCLKESFSGSNPSCQDFSPFQNNEDLFCSMSRENALLCGALCRDRNDDDYDDYDDDGYDGDDNAVNDNTRDTDKKMAEEALDFCENEMDQLCVSTFGLNLSFIPTVYVAVTEGNLLCGQFKYRLDSVDI